MSGLARHFREGPALYTVPPGEPFLPALARELLAAYADDPLGLADVTLYLPSRRAKREAASAFLAERAGETALFLPQLRSLGDVDEEDLLLSGAPVEAEASLPPPADGLERRLVLARFLRRAREAAREPVPGWPSALVGADELARLLDEFHTEGVGLDALAPLVTDEDVPQGAAHWQRALDFLAVVTEVWPAWVRQQGRMDGAERRRRLMEAMAAPDLGARGPVIVAGSLGTVPATARFMRHVAELPSGLVVLPGVDLTLDEKAWAEIEPPHPQALFNTLLREHFGGLSRDAIRAWPGEKPGEGRGEARAAFLTLALRPAEATDDWHDRLATFRKEGRTDAALTGLRLATAASEDEEAGFVALLMREALETEGKTCTLVTPDRNLARRVRSKLKLWDVEVDDSGGVPLGGTYRGTFLRAVARWLCDVSDPIALSEVCAHPLCRIGQKAEDHAAGARALNRCLRGQRPGPGFDGVRRLLTSEGFRVTGGGRETVVPRALALLDRLEAAAQPFLQARGTPERLQAHVEVAQALANAARESGEARLWRYEDGEALAVLVAELMAQGPMLPEDDGDYADLFDALIAGPVVRKRGGHPRLAILGLLEARLQHADRVILSGLNEGVWPGEPRQDAFLSRPMRKAVGLPSPEMVVGRTAHDFSQLAAAPEVFLTRSVRQGSGPAEASRWLVRLQSFVAAVGAAEGCDETQRLRGLLAALHGGNGDPVPAAPPRPTPPADLRPTRFSVTELEKLIRDPYGIYAKKVLDLPALRPLTRDVDPSARGTFYHEVFARFAKRWAAVAPPDPVRALTEVAEALMDEEAMPQALRALWRPRLRVAFETFAGLDAALRDRGRLAGAEAPGRWVFEREGRSYTITARADRIDVDRDGRALLLDYKTGGAPTLTQAERFSPQIAVMVLMLEAGAFEELGPVETGGAGYVEAVPSAVPSRHLKPGSKLAFGDKLSEHVETARERLFAWLDEIARPDAPFLSQPRAFMKDAYGEYDHLARRGEWAAQEGEE